MAESPLGGYDLNNIADLLDITPRRLQQLAKDGFIPKNRRGKYPLVGSVQGYIRYLRANRTNSTKTNNNKEYIDQNKERALLNREIRISKEMENQQTRKQLISVNDFDTEYSRLVKITAATLETLPDLLERDAGLKGRQLAPVFKTIDGLRETLFLALTNREKPDV